MKLFDHVVSKKAFVPEGIPKGATGVVMAIHAGGEGLTVDFLDSEGWSLGVVTEGAGCFEAKKGEQ